MTENAEGSYTPPAMDVHFGIKKLNLQNWHERDPAMAAFTISKDEWVSRILEPQLIASVPENVTKLFEVARSSVAYGWFYYPLLTLASEQLFRVQETAVRERCRLAQISVIRMVNGKPRDRNFAELITELINAGIIPADSVTSWDAGRALRNFASHPANQVINVPSAAIAAVQVCARKLNQLFADNHDFFTALGERVRNKTGLDRKSQEFPVVAGIDVGGENKGFHVVALRGPTLLGTLQTNEPAEVVSWCTSQDAVLVAVDAPCGWSQGGEFRSREAERQLALRGYSSHATPVRDKATEKAFHAWMLNGERLYSALGHFYPLYRGQSPLPTKFSFETYPHVAACGFSGKRLSASDKNKDRRNIIHAAGIEDSSLKNVDLVDAALCALVAYSVHTGHCLTLEIRTKDLCYYPLFPEGSSAFSSYSKNVK